MINNITLTGVPLQDAWKDFLGDLHTPRPSYNYGYKRLTDDLHTGPGHMVIIGAQTGVGKSLLGWLICKNMAAAGARVAYLSLEMSREDLMARNAARSGTMAAIMRGDATRLQEEAMRAQAQEEAKLPIEIVPAAGCSVEHIAAYIHANSGIKVVCIDYLQLLTGAGDRYQVTTANSIALANLAHSTGVCIIGLVQLLIKGDAAQGVPTMASVQATSQYVQDADALILMHRETPDDANSRRILKIEKNRHGPAGGRVYLDFDGNRMQLTESDDQTARTPAPAPKKTYDFGGKKAKVKTTTTDTGDDLPF